MAFSPDPSSTSSIFVHPTLQSAIDHLSTYLQKHPSSPPSHFHNQLTKLNQSLLLLLETHLPFTTPSSAHLLTQIKGVAESADDLVNEIEFERLHQEVEEFNRSNPSEPIVGPSISQFRGFQTGESDIPSQAIQDASEGGNQTHQISNESQPVVKHGGSNAFKKLFSAICKLCNCLDKKSVTSIAHDSLLPNASTSNIDTNESQEGGVGYRLDKLVEQLGYLVAPVDSGIKCKDNGNDFGGSDGVMNGCVINGEVYGREGEREQLVNMLLESSEETVSVVQIIGVGGVGKTTLANYVYRDERVQRHFHIQEWVCASDTFDMMRMAGVLEESLYLSGPFDQIQLLDLYERNLAILKGKRFLLVLDDVRSVEWVSRFTAIDSDGKGSKILLTAQEEYMIDEEARKKKIVLEGVKGEEFWSFFRKCSFGSEDPNKHPELLIIGKEIVEKLGGSPLAAKMVGGALREKLDRVHWMNILRSELCELGKASGDVMPFLRLSYQHLPLQLQWCFAYCSVFPKGYAFEINKLVQMWMAQGLINSEKGGEVTGRKYFCYLLSRSFFELPSYTKSYWRSKYYLMHELLHDLASLVCSDEISVYVGQGSREIQKGVCHLSVTLWADLNSEFEWRNLRSLIINTKHFLELDLLKRVRVLDLSHSYMGQLPDSIGNLIHLRYLNLSGNYIYSLPESLCNLYHLQYMTVTHKCHRLPKGMANLINLRHLDATEEAVSWISCIGRLTCLQELKVFHVKRVNGHDVGQLKNMRELRGQLCIQYLDDVNSKEEAIAANLKEKIHLSKLLLKWMRWNPKRKPDTHDDILECLEPPMSLNELEIHWYKGSRSPRWLEKQSLQCLKFLHLRGCKNWNTLPPLGSMHFLEVLKIADMVATVEGVGETDDMFPSLKELWLEDTSITFEGVPTILEERQKLFPCLCKLSVLNSKMIKGLPPLSMLQTLSELNVRKCPDFDAEMPGCFMKLTSLTTLKISELQLTSFPGEVLQWLKHLEIDSCENLTSWPVNEEEEGILSSLTSLSITDSLLPTGPVLQKYLTSLQELRLNRCSKLKSFTTEQQKWFEKLILLRELCITDCPSLRVLPMNLHHLTSLRNLTVANCPTIRSLPTSLPDSLRRLEFSNCNPGLAVQWQDERAPEWVKRVPFRYI